MLLVLDVGNTNITIGVYQGEKLEASMRMTTILRTSDEYGVLLCEMLKLRNISLEAIEAVAIASVVPKIMHAMNNAIIRYFNLKPLVVGPGVKSGIKLANENPKEIGADRIVDAVAAYDYAKGAVIVLDFGTATTYDLITADGTFAVGVTAPGIQISARALWNDTAKLPEIEIAKPDSILARNTVTSMQAGLVYGQIGQTEYIVRRIKEESGYTDAKVIATGGFGKMIADATDVIDCYDPNLSLNGIRMVWSKNSANRS